MSKLVKAPYDMLEAQVAGMNPIPVVNPHGVEVSGPYGPHVTIVCKPAVAPFCDLVVRVRDIHERSGWRDVAKFNDVDPLAHANAHARALYERRKILEGEAS